MSERHRPIDMPANPPGSGRRGAWLALAGLVVLGHVWLINAWLRRPPAEDRVGTPAPLAALDTRTAQAVPSPEVAPAPKPGPMIQPAEPAKPAQQAKPAQPVQAKAIPPVKPAATAVANPVAEPPARVKPTRHDPAAAAAALATSADAPRHTAAQKAPAVSVPPSAGVAAAMATAEPAASVAAAEPVAVSAAAPMPDPALLLAMAPTGAGPAAAVAVSTGATSALASNLPPSAQLNYRLSKGLLSGTGRIDWTLAGDTYRLRLEARVPVLGQIFQQTSEGRIDANGVAPVRHTESAIRRSQRAVSFVRDTSPPRIQFSAREGNEPLRAGAQDRVSWIAQLVGRLGARAPADWTPGSRIEMDVASVGGDVQHWVFTIIGRDSDNQWHLRREADGPRDTRAEVWLDPSRHLWPTRIRLTEPSGDPLELTLSGIESS